MTHASPRSRGATQPVIVRPSSRAASRTSRSSQASRAPSAVVRFREPPPAQSYLDDPECIALREAIFSATKPPSFKDIGNDTLRHFHTHLKEYEILNSNQENYPEAAAARNLAEEVRAVLVGLEQAKGEFRPDPEDEIRKQDLLASHAGKIREYEEDTRAKRQTMLRRHAEQLGRLDEHWTERRPPRYRKPDRVLLNLKAVERAAANSGDYDRATVLHREADSLATLQF
jgi:hypothetical protein